MYVIFDRSSQAWIGFQRIRVSSLFDAIKFKTARQAEEFMHKGMIFYGEVCHWKGG